MGLIAWIKKRILRQKPTKSVYEPTKSLENHAVYGRPIYLPKPGSQIIAKGYGKHMKSGRTAPWYRKQIKGKVKPEEETN